MSANERFRVLNEQIFAARGEDMQIEIDGAEQLLTHSDSITPEAACTSVQLHVQVSPEAFAGYWNAAQSDRRGAGRARGELPVPVRPPALAGDPDHAVRAGHRHPAGRAEAAGRAPRVWFGERWITSVFDLFEENIQFFPALLPICEDEDPLAVLDAGGCPQLAEMSLHNGTVYRWNRPVYGSSAASRTSGWRTGCCPAGPPLPM